MKELREYTGMKKDHENDHGRLRGKIHADNDWGKTGGKSVELETAAEAENPECKQGSKWKKTVHFPRWHN